MTIPLILVYNSILYSKWINICYVQRADAIDPALRRFGRFDVEIEVTPPTEEERIQILKVRVMLKIFF